MRDIVLKPSTCIECSVNCGSLVSVKSGTVKDVRPKPAHPGSNGAICIKGMKGSTGLTYADNRLLYPLRRVGDCGAGQWKRASRAEAFKGTADRLRTTQEKHRAIALAGATKTVAGSRGLIVSLLMRSLSSPNLMINQDLGERPVGGILRNRAYGGHLRNRRKCCPYNALQIPRNSSR
jgi:thiosulfate reductase / polysulfide reductase chain A